MVIQEANEKVGNFMQINSYSTESIEAYQACIRSFFAYCSANKNAKNMPHKERIEAYLTYLVTERNVSPSTQNQHLHALLLLHNKVLGLNIQGVDAMRAKYRRRIPPILSKEQVKGLIEALPNEYQLAGKIMYGTGLRIKECLRIRIKDVDFENGKIIVHEGKGDKDRDVPIPKSLNEKIKFQIDKAKTTWESDRREKIGGVFVPNALSTKYPKASTSLEWYWLFPNQNTTRDPQKGIQCRHHVYTWQLETAFVQSRRALKLPEYATPHSLRHACFTHMAQDMIAQGMPERMIKEVLRDLAGHSTKDTIDTYIHLATPANSVVRSPLDMEE